MQRTLLAAFPDVIEQFKGKDARFSQPIEMRINEMLTGIRADVALKLFGNDLDMLLSCRRPILTFNAPQQETPG